jgi:iron complex transport system ATP-binding protein
MNTLPVTVIRLRGVTLDAGGRRLVDALDLDVERGQRWVILGPNGAGKSTLLSALAGLRCADGGAIELAGRGFDGWPIEALAGLRAVMTDRWIDPFAATALDTVLTARYRFGEHDANGLQCAQQELDRLDCAALADHDVRTLSRGERQRVALATALAQDTPLLLLDEPTSHQDPRHQQLVMRRLASLGDRTLVASMHDVNAAQRLATHVLLLAGNGSWQAGPAPQVLTAERLGALFGTPFLAVDVPGGRRLQPAHLPDAPAA